MAQEFDVCVFGAGPAALSVAARLIDRGRTVAILDRPPRAKAWGGESFSGAIRGPLVALGLWEAFTRAGHVRAYERQVAWGADPQCESALVHPDGQWWHVDRRRFDDDMRAAIGPRAGGFLTYGLPRLLARAAGTWRIVVDEGRELSARYLVDATGRSRALSKRLGARVASHDRLVGMTARVSRDASPFHVASLMMQSTPFGWWYAAPVPHGHVVALFTDADLAGATARTHLRPVAANSAFTHVAEGEGWTAVGDARASHDPLCGWGVHRALTNGMLAAEAIDDALRTGSTSSPRDYGDRCERQFDEYLQGLTRHYSMERRWASAPFWQRRHNSPRMTAGGRI